MQVSRRGFYVLMSGAAVSAASLLSACSTPAPLVAKSARVFTPGRVRTSRTAVSSVRLQTPQLPDPATLVQWKKMKLILELQKALVASGLPAEVQFSPQSDGDFQGGSGKPEGSKKASHAMRLTLWNAVLNHASSAILRYTVQVELFDLDSPQPDEVVWKYETLVKGETFRDDRNVASSVVSHLQRDGLSVAQHP